MPSRKKLGRYTRLLEVIAANPRALNKELAKLVGCSESTVTRSIAELREYGWVRLAVNAREAFDFTERVRLSIQFDAKGKSKKYNYNGQAQFTSFLANCTSNGMFPEFEGRLQVESVETTLDSDEDVVAIINSDSSEIWSNFCSIIKSLDGVIGASMQQLFKIE